MIIGYPRVSTCEQSLDAQHAALKAHGAEKIFAEKVSGARTDRAALAKAIAMLREGDVLLVTRLDRLARSKDCEITPRTCQRYMKLAGDLMRW
jgi:DNA invertase Pin-like site-specific DNA recombinase